MKRPYIEDAEDHISTAAVEGSAVKLIPAQSILCVVRDASWPTPSPSPLPGATWPSTRT